MEEVVFQGKKYPIHKHLSPKTDDPRQSIPLRQLRIANAGIKRLEEIEGIFDANAIFLSFFLCFTLRNLEHQ